MKKYFYIFIMFIIFILLLSGCSENIVEDEGHNTGQKPLSTEKSISDELEKDESITELNWSSDRKIAAFLRDIGDYNYKLHIWKVGEAKELEIEGVKGNLYGLNWSPNGKYLIVNNGTSIVKTSAVIPIEDLENIKWVTNIGNTIWSPDSKRILIGVENDIKPSEEIELNGTVDLAIYNVEDSTSDILLEAESAFYYSPSFWEDDNLIGFRKIYLGESREIENLTMNLETREIKGIISSSKAKEIIQATSNEVINLLKEKNMEKLSEYVHPKKGVRFTPYTWVSIEEDIVFYRPSIVNFFNDSNKYLWGYYDGIGNEVNLSPSEYYEQFIYNEDFANPEEISYNEILSRGNMLENQFEVYHNPIVVEYYFSGFNPEYSGMDWQSLRLVYENYQNSWYLVGIIHNQWTI